MLREFCLGLFVLVLLPISCKAQERPYFSTYSHEMEEPGNLEIEFLNISGKPPEGNRFLGSSLEVEYGIKTWWTTEFYLDGQTTQNESTIFTGYRWENRFRPLLREHWINPVLYVEFEDINGADKTLREIVGHDGKADLSEPNDRGQSREEAGNRVEVDSGQQLQRLERERKHHCGEEPCQ